MYILVYLSDYLILRIGKGSLGGALRLGMCIGKYDRCNNQVGANMGKSTRPVYWGHTKASSAFHTEGFSKSVCLNNNATILQAQLYAIKMALQHSNNQSLSRRVPRDNKDFINTIFRMSKNKTVTPIINWVPSHTGFHGNEEKCFCYNSYKFIGYMSGHQSQSLL